MELDSFVNELIPRLITIEVKMATVESLSQKIVELMGAIASETQQVQNTIEQLRRQVTPDLQPLVDQLDMAISRVNAMADPVPVINPPEPPVEPTPTEPVE